MRSGAVSCAPPRRATRALRVSWPLRSALRRWPRCAAGDGPPSGPSRTSGDNRPCRRRTARPCRRRPATAGRREVSIRCRSWLMRMTAPSIFGQRLRPAPRGCRCRDGWSARRGSAVRPVEGREAEQQPRLLAAGKVVGRRVHACSAAKPKRAGARADLRLGGVRHQRAHVLVGGLRRVRARRAGAGRSRRPSACRRGAGVPPIGASRPASSLAQVDLPLPLAPSSAMRSSSSMRRLSRRQHRLARLVADRDVVHADDRRRQRASPAGKAERRRRVSSAMAAIGSIFASAFSRLCAWRAFEAL